MPYDAHNLTETQRVFLRAAEIVRERWKQGDYGETGGPRCAMGALMEASNSSVIMPAGVYEPAHRAFGGRIVGFNDAPGRTAEQVAAKLESAAFMGDE